MVDGDEAGDDDASGDAKVERGSVDPIGKCQNNQA